MYKVKMQSMRVNTREKLNTILDTLKKQNRKALWEAKDGFNFNKQDFNNFVIYYWTI